MEVTCPREWGDSVGEDFWGLGRKGELFREESNRTEVDLEGEGGERMRKFTTRRGRLREIETQCEEQG